jgi:hypothetical protein
MDPPQFAVTANSAWHAAHDEQLHERVDHLLAHEVAVRPDRQALERTARRHAIEPEAPTFSRPFQVFTTPKPSGASGEHPRRA